MITPIKPLKTLKYVWLFVLLYRGANAQQRKALVVSTTGDLSMKLSANQVRMSDTVEMGIKTIRLYPKQRYQTIMGFGGTYSEATSFNLKKLSAKKRGEVVSALFDKKKGANWTMIRTTINSCDASSEYYDYDSSVNDTLLTHFSIQKDIDNFMIPGLQSFLKIQPTLKVFASPWTPPVWLKDIGKHNEGTLKKEFYQTWANYISKYLAAYKREGVAIWGITPQNEPEAYKQAWDACGWKVNDMNEFVKNNLGPTVRKAHPAVKFLAWDHNKNHLMDWCNVLLKDPETAKYFSYIAHHWYDGGEGKYYDPLQEAQKAFPKLPLIAAEQGVFGLYLRKPEPAELYATDIIANMNNWSVAWIAWGMVFDEKGGPNHANNHTHSPIMVNTANEEVYYNPSYYYIAHFSKYVQAKAVRIGFDNEEKDLKVTAFLNPDGKKTIVILNTTDAPKTIQIVENNKSVRAELRPHAIITVLL